MRDRWGRFLDEAAAVLAGVHERTLWVRRWYTPVTVAFLSLVGLVAVFRTETSGPNYDPQYMRVLVERTIRFGGSYYSNGIHNKGPFEPVVYEIARRVGGDDGFWFVLAVFTLIAALCVGLAAAVVTVRVGAPTIIGVCVATMTVTHLMLSEADYAGVLYARNMTVAMLALAFAVAAIGRCWATPNRRLVATLAVGVLTGLAVQTLLTACFTASPVLLWAMWTRRDVRVSRLGNAPAWLLMPIVSALTLVAAPLYYRVFGPWREFTDGWWVYARFMSEGTGRSLASQFHLGWDQFVDYYSDRPALAAAIVVAIAVTAVRWRRLTSADRALRILVGVWFVGAWFELVLSQRYSSHYFSVLAVPSILMLAVLVGEIGGHWRPFIERRPARALLPIVVVLITVQIDGTAPVDVGVEAAGEFSGIDDFTERREAGVGGQTRFVRASLDLVSAPGDPMLMWTSYPWPYLDLDRVSATRYIWKTFLLGEIYLGNSGPEYVLPGTWDRFDGDLADADPAVFLVESVNPVVADTPFARAVDERFTMVYSDEVSTIGYRNDLAAWIASVPSDSDALATGDEATAVTLSEHGCVRVDGGLSGLLGLPLTIEFGDAGIAGRIDVSFDVGGRYRVDSLPAGAPGHTVAGGPSADGSPGPFAVIVGQRSAALVIDGQIVGAIDLVEPDVAVELVGLGSVDVSSLRTSHPIPETGCVSGGRG